MPKPKGKQGLEDKCVQEYKVLKKVGEGGFSEVYLVTPSVPALENVFFAMKFVSDAIYFPLLESEMRLLARLEHPQIPRPIMAGDFEEGRFLVMDFVPLTLQNIIDKTETGTCSGALSITADVLRVLDYAHSKSIVHKDLKPKNIGINKEGKVILLDFNISKELLELTGADSTQEGVQNTSIDSDFVKIGNVQKSLLGGTPGYQSPEQLKLKIDGQIYPVDHRTDIFSAGVILYQMLTGSLPYGNFKFFHVKEEDKEVFPETDINNVLLKAMSSSPNRRYQSAREMLNDIESILRQIEENKGKKDILASLCEMKSDLKKGEKQNRLKRFFQFIGVIGTITAGAYLHYFNSIEDSKFIEEFKKDPRGTIVYQTKEKKIALFKVRDILDDVIRYKEIGGDLEKVDDVFYEDNGVLYISGETGGLKIIKEINLKNGKTKVMVSKGSAGRIINLDLFEGDKLIFQFDGEDKWYSIDNTKESVQEEKIALKPKRKTNPLICPHGTHKAGSNLFGEIKLKRFDKVLGSYSLPLKGEPIAWVDYEL